jgi:aldehyde:ferredoxin oxidoreductase
MNISNCKILQVNLSDQTYTVQEPSESFLRRYLGGRGLIAYYLLKEIPPNADPLGPENVMVFAASVVTGTLLAGTSRFSAGAKSPLTGGYGEGEAGGPWGPELRAAGYIAIIVKGVSEKPVYLYITNDSVEFHDASAAWGKDTGEAMEIIRAEVGDEKAQVTGIGQAGENLVRIASIISKAKHAIGRCGLGAVMGSKKLKAIVVRGKQKVEFENPEGLAALRSDFVKHFRENADNKMLNKYGTSQYFLNINVAGLSPTRNFRYGVMENYKNLGHHPYHTEYNVKSDACPGCAVACKQVVASKEGSPYDVSPVYGGPEFETISSFSTVSGNNDLHAMMKGGELANRYGLDSIATGNMIGFAIECYEKGFLTDQDTGGIELKWGDPDLMVRLVKMIAFRDGFGNMLADGVKRLSDKLGPETAGFAMQVKGQEFPMHDPRGKYGVGLAYAVSPTGADHLQHEHDGAFDPHLAGYSHESDEPSVFGKQITPLGIYEAVPSLSLGSDKVRLFTYLQDYWSFFEMLDLCIFTFAPVRYFKVDHIVEIVKNATGWNVSFWELMKAGERGTTMARVFNLKHGLTYKDDTLPERMFQGIENGPLEGAAIPKEDLYRAIKLYYEMMGWTEDTGIPRYGKLVELQVEWTAEYLPKAVVSQ